MKLRYYVGIWLLLVTGGFPKAALGQTEYFALFMEGRKVGHAIRSRAVTDRKVTSAEGVSIQLSRAGVAVSISTMETCIETTDGEPLGFEVAQDLGIATTKVVGIVNEAGMVSVATTTMGVERKGEFAWPSGAVMAEGLRLLELKQGLREGTSYTAKVFSPAILQTLETEIRIGPKQNIDLLGRVVALTEVTTTYGMPGAGVIVSTSYVDEELRVQKDILPIAGMQMEIIACAKEFALGENEVFEVIDKLFLASPRPLGDIGSARSIVYHLSPTKATDLLIPSTDNQSVRRLRDGGAIVTVKPVAAPAGARFPYRGRDRVVLEAMKPNSFLQSDNKEIIELARRAVGGTKGAAEAARRIESFVAGYIENQGLSVGYASAAEVAASRVGDCSEHAVLVAAMCRAVGIPAQMVVGIAYVEEFGGLQERFGGHAWVQAYVGGKWVGLDSAFKSVGLEGYGPGHIALAVGNGEPADFFNLVTTLGQFRIDKVVVNKGR
jgi:hypothetical protein